MITVDDMRCCSPAPEYAMAASSIDGGLYHAAVTVYESARGLDTADAALALGNDVLRFGGVPDERAHGFLDHAFHMNAAAFGGDYGEFLGALGKVA